MKFAKRFAVVSSVAAVFAANAMAALPAEVGTTVTAAKADITEAGTLILGVSLAIAAVFWLRRVMR